MSLCADSEQPTVSRYMYISRGWDDLTFTIKWNHGMITFQTEGSSGVCPVKLQFALMKKLDDCVETMENHNIKMSHQYSSITFELDGTEFQNVYEVKAYIIKMINEHVINDLKYIALGKDTEKGMSVIEALQHAAPEMVVKGHVKIFERQSCICLVGNKDSFDTVAKELNISIKLTAVSARIKKHEKLQLTAEELGCLQILEFEKYCKDKVGNVYIDYTNGELVGNQHGISQARAVLEEFQKSLVTKKVVFKHRDCANIFLEENGADNINVLAYVCRMLKCSNITACYVGMGKDRSLPEVTVTCRDDSSAQRAREVVSGCVNIHQIVKFDSKEAEIFWNEWNKKKKLYKADGNENYLALICTSDLSPKIIDIHDRILSENTSRQLSFSLPLLVIYFLKTFGESTVKDTEDKFDVKIDIDVDENKMYIRGPSKQVEKDAKHYIKGEIQKRLKSLTVHIPDATFTQSLPKLEDAIARHECCWTSKYASKGKELHVKNGSYVATWYDPSNHGKVTLIEGNPAELDVDLLLLCVTDNLFPVHPDFLEHKAAFDAYYAACKDLGRHHYSVGEVILIPIHCENIGSKAVMALVIHKTQESFSEEILNLPSIINKVMDFASKQKHRTVGLSLSLIPEVPYRDILQKVTSAAVMYFQGHPDVAMEMCLCGNRSTPPRDSLVESLDKVFTEGRGFARKVYQNTAIISSTTEDWQKLEQDPNLGRQITINLIAKNESSLNTVVDEVKEILGETTVDRETSRVSPPLGPQKQPSGPLTLDKGDMNYNNMGARPKSKPLLTNPEPVSTESSPTAPAASPHTSRDGAFDADLVFRCFTAEVEPLLLKHVDIDTLLNMSALFEVSVNVQNKQVLVKGQHDNIMKFGENLYSVYSVTTAIHHLPALRKPDSGENTNDCKVWSASESESRGSKTRDTTKEVHAKRIENIMKFEDELYKVTQSQQLPGLGNADRDENTNYQNDLLESDSESDEWETITVSKEDDTKLLPDANYEHYRKSELDAGKSKTIRKPATKEIYAALNFLFKEDTNHIIKNSSGMSYVDGEICIESESSQEVEQKLDSILAKMREVQNAEVLLDANEMMQANDVVQGMADKYNTLYCYFVPNDSKIGIMGFDYQEVKEAENKVKKNLGRPQQQASSRRQFDIQTKLVDHAATEQRNNEGQRSLAGPVSVDCVGTIDGVIVKIYKGNITKLQVDCIVNAANERLSSLVGVGQAISRAAGRAYDEECRSILQMYGKLRIGEIRETTAGALPYKFVIQAVASAFDSQIQKAKRLDILTETIQKCLQHADGRGVSSIALPSIAAGGATGLTVEECASQYCSAVSSFCSRRQSITEINFVDINTKTVDVIKSAFAPLFDGQDTGNWSSTSTTPVPSSFTSQSSPAVCSATALSGSVSMYSPDKAAGSHRSVSMSGSTSLRLQVAGAGAGNPPSYSDVVRSKEAPARSPGETNTTGDSGQASGEYNNRSKATTGQAGISISPYSDLVRSKEAPARSPGEANQSVDSRHVTGQASGGYYTRSKAKTGQAAITTDPAASETFRHSGISDISFAVPSTSVTIRLVQGDIVATPADVIVSIEDKSFSGTGAIARKIRNNGKHAYRYAHSYLQMQNKNINVTEVVVTNSFGGKLVCKHVFHAISPHWSKRYTQSAGEFERDIRMTVKHILQKAADMKLRSVALPFFGTSVDEQNHPTPVTTCCMSIVAGILEWVCKSQQHSIDQIILVCIDSACLLTFKPIIEDKIQRIADPAAAVTTASVTKPQDVCSLCMKAITREQRQLYLACGHISHEACVNLRRAMSSPVCKLCSISRGRSTVLYM